MDSVKEKSIGGSKADLNESNLPLLDDQEDNKSIKEKIELETKETVDNGESKELAKEQDAEKEKDKAKKKGHRRTISCADNFTIGVNLLDRDEKGVNEHVNLTFEDVLAEPDASQGLNGSWKLAYLVFTTSRLWIYRLVTALLALPLGLVWGIIFSLLSILHVWFFTPFFKTLDLLFHVVHRIWEGTVQTVLDPVFRSVSLLLGGIKVTSRQEFPDSPKDNI